MSRIAVCEQFEPAIQTIEDYALEIQGYVEEVFSNAEELVNKTNYDIVYKTFFQLESTYNDNVLSQVKKSIEEWAESEASYYNLAKSVGLGEEVLNTAKNQQNKIVEVITSMKNIENLNSYKENADADFDLENVKKELEDINEKAKKINDINDDHTQKLKEYAEENEMAKSLISVGIVFGNTITEFIIETTNLVNGILNEQFDVITKNIEAASQNAIANSKAAVERNKQYVEEVNKKTRDLFD